MKIRYFLVPLSLVLLSGCVGDALDEGDEAPADENTASETAPPPPPTVTITPRRAPISNLR